jgi:cation transport ATPase
MMTKVSETVLFINRIEINGIFRRGVQQMAIKLEKEIEKITRPEKQKKSRKKKKQEKRNLEKQKRNLERQMKRLGSKIALDKKMEPEKKKKKRRRLYLGENKGEVIGGIVLMIGLLFLILAFILWGVSELIEENFIMSEIVGAYCSASIGLCFGLVFIGMIIAIRNWLARIAFLLFAGVFLSVSYHFIETAGLLYQDKEVYENKQFERLVAIPTGEEYDDPDYGPVYLMELEFKKLTIDVYNLDISRNYYKENLSGKPLEITYLPNSRFAISVEEYVE